MSIADQKAALRSALRRRRGIVDAAARAAASTAVTRALLATPSWQAARSIAGFVGTASEPDTRALLQDALAHGKTLWLPRVLDGRAGRSELVRVHDLGVLAPAGFGLVEPAPRPGEITAPAIAPALQIDLVLVPGLAFGRDGARIGHGPGHYDRLLAPVRELGMPWRVGVALATMIDPPEGPIPLQPHDVPMHALASELGITVCAPR